MIDFTHLEHYRENNRIETKKALGEHLGDLPGTPGGTAEPSRPAEGLI